MWTMRMVATEWSKRFRNEFDKMKENTIPHRKWKHVGEINENVKTEAKATWQDIFYTPLIYKVHIGIFGLDVCVMIYFLHLQDLYTCVTAVLHTLNYYYMPYGLFVILSDGIADAYLNKFINIVCPTECLFQFILQWYCGDNENCEMCDFTIRHFFFLVLWSRPTHYYICICIET